MLQSATDNSSTLALCVAAHRHHYASDVAIIKWHATCFSIHSLGTIVCQFTELCWC